MGKIHIQSLQAPLVLDSRLCPRYFTPNSAYLWLAATKPKRCDSFTDWVHLIPMGWMNASLFSNLFIFMFFSHRLLFLISMATLFLLASFSSLCLYKLYIFWFSSHYSDDGLTSETSVSILSLLRCRIYIFITKLCPRYFWSGLKKILRCWLVF